MNEDGEMVDLKKVLLEGEDSRENKIPMHLKEYERYIKDCPCWMVLSTMAIESWRQNLYGARWSRYSTRPTRELRGCFTQPSYQSHGQDCTRTWGERGRGARLAT